ncbi:hypothetical protein AB7C87_24040 [Natrarchaeobius sp. A-rgal3]|uniref:hypothetical protein n=1 Tax=Natrarchaeobius versutus TaxID=1679078 RepID=UPI00350F236C
MKLESIECHLVSIHGKETTSILIRSYHRSDDCPGDAGDRTTGGRYETITHDGTPD